MIAGGFTKQQLHDLDTASTVGGALSVVGCLLIIATNLKWRDLRAHFSAMRMVYLLSLANLISSIGYLLDATNAPSLCQLQGLALQFGHVAAWGWTCCFAFSLYRHVLYRASNETLQSYEPVYHAISWSLASSSTVIVFAEDAIGNLGPWCWIKAGHNYLRFAVFYGPLVIAMVFTLTTYVMIMRGFAPSKRTLPVQRSIASYMLVFIFTMVWGLINRIQNWANPDEPVFLLNMLHAVFNPLQGFLNVIVFAVTLPVLRERYVSVLSRNPDAGAGQSLDAPIPGDTMIAT